MEWEIHHHTSDLVFGMPSTFLQATANVLQFRHTHPSPGSQNLPHLRPSAIANLSFYKGNASRSLYDANANSSFYGSNASLSFYDAMSAALGSDKLAFMARGKCNSDPIQSNMHNPLLELEGAPFGFALSAMRRDSLVDLGTEGAAVRLGRGLLKNYEVVSEEIDVSVSDPSKKKHPSPAHLKHLNRKESERQSIQQPKKLAKAHKDVTGIVEKRRHDAPKGQTKAKKVTERRQLLNSESKKQDNKDGHRADLGVGCLACPHQTKSDTNKQMYDLQKKSKLPQKHVLSASLGTTDRKVYETLDQKEKKTHHTSRHLLSKTSPSSRVGKEPEDTESTQFIETAYNGVAGIQSGRQKHFREYDVAPARRDAHALHTSSDIRMKESTPNKKESTPNKRESTPNKKESTPNKRESTSEKKESTPNKRESTPNKKESTLNKRESTPNKRESTSEKKNPPPASAKKEPSPLGEMKESTSDKTESTSYKRESTLNKRESTPNRRESTLNRRESTPNRRESTLNKRESTPNKREFPPKKTEFTSNKGESAARKKEPGPSASVRNRTSLASRGHPPSRGRHLLTKGLLVPKDKTKHLNSPKQHTKDVKKKFDRIKKEVLPPSTTSKRHLHGSHGSKKPSGRRHLLTKGPKGPGLFAPKEQAKHLKGLKQHTKDVKKAFDRVRQGAAPPSTNSKRHLHASHKRSKKSSRRRHLLTGEGHTWLSAENKLLPDEDEKAPGDEKQYVRMRGRIRYMTRTGEFKIKLDQDQNEDRRHLLSSEKSAKAKNKGPVFAPKEQAKHLKGLKQHTEDVKKAFNRVRQDAAPPSTTSKRHLHASHKGSKNSSGRRHLLTDQDDTAGRIPEECFL